MARETKIGIALMALLLGVFGFVAYKKWDGLKTAVASKAGVTESANPAPEKGDPATPGGTEPPGNPFAAAEPASAPPSEQPDTAGDPFAAASGSAVPVRPVSATAADAWTDAPPIAQSEPVPEQTPMDASAAALPPGQGEPTAPAEPAEDFPEDTAATVAEADPFGDATSSPVAEGSSKGAAPMPSEDPFAGSSESPAVANSSAPAAEPVAAVDDATDPFDAAQPAGPTKPAPSASETGTSEDPFAEATAGGEPHLASEADASAPDDAPSGEDGQTAQLPADEGQTSAFADATEPSAPFDADEFAPAAASAAPVEDVTELAGIEPEPDAFNEASATEPAVGGSPATPRTDYRVVAENDTYWSISQRVYGTPVFFQALAKYNQGRIEDPKRLRPGMKVLTPPASELAALVPNQGGVEGTATAGPAGFLLDESRRPAYRVAEGDTLGKIAQSHLGRASRWVQIYNLNREIIPDAKTLKPGTVLRLPADASRVRLVPEG